MTEALHVDLKRCVYFDDLASTSSLLAHLGMTPSRLGKAQAESKSRISNFLSDGLSRQQIQEHNVKNRQQDRDHAPDGHGSRSIRGTKPLVIRLGLGLRRSSTKAERTPVRR